MLLTCPLPHPPVHCAQVLLHDAEVLAAAADDEDAAILGLNKVRLMVPHLLGPHPARIPAVTCVHSIVTWALTLLH